MKSLFGMLYIWLYSVIAYIFQTADALQYITSVCCKYIFSTALFESLICLFAFQTFASVVKLCNSKQKINVEC